MSSENHNFADQCASFYYLATTSGIFSSSETGSDTIAANQNLRGIKWHKKYTLFSYDQNFKAYLRHFIQSFGIYSALFWTKPHCTFQLYKFQKIGNFRVYIQNEIFV